MSDEATFLRRRAGFDGVAELYDVARPRYPDALVDDLVTLAGLRPGGRVLEIGCGPGQLTVALARRGLEITGVELGPALAAVARRNLASFPRARVVVGAFEDHAVTEPFDAVVAASSFHRVPPDVRVARSAAALRPGGTLVVVDVRPVADGDEGFFAASQDCYLRFDPAAEPGFVLPAADALPPAYPELDASPHFATMQRRRHSWEVVYSADRYCALLSTYSNHIDLPDDRREGLLTCIADLIDSRFGGAITKRHPAELVIAHRS